MKGDVMTPQSIHNRYIALLNKHDKIGFSEIELRDFLMKIGALHEDYVKIMPIPDDKVLELSDLYLHKRDWWISPRDKIRLERKLRGEE